MIGFICILTLVQMILTAFSMLFGSWLQPVAAGTFFLDHLTMAVSGLGGVDERTALDYLSTRLEMMVKELDFSLIVVSHVNDNGLNPRIKEHIQDRRHTHRSGSDIINPDPTIRRTTHVTVSKNRFCGRTGPAGSLLFRSIDFIL